MPAMELPRVVIAQGLGSIPRAVRDSAEMIIINGVVVADRRGLLFVPRPATQDDINRAEAAYI